MKILLQEIFEKSVPYRITTKVSHGFSEWIAKFRVGKTPYVWKADKFENDPWQVQFFLLRPLFMTWKELVLREQETNFLCLLSEYWSIK